jgi:hypothetical protein
MELKAENFLLRCLREQHKLCPGSPYIVIRIRVCFITANARKSESYLKKENTITLFIFGLTCSGEFGTAPVFISVKADASRSARHYVHTINMLAK